MNQTMTEILHDAESNEPQGGSTANSTEMNSEMGSGMSQLVLHFPKWRTKAILIESLIIISGFVCVVIYNWLFNATISPLLGVIIGAINGSLVAWCITHAEQISKRNR